MVHTVLLVDDEPNVLAGLQRALRKEPYTTICANSADEALSILRSRIVDAVVSDQDMPGMTGTALLAKVREEFPHTVRFILTGKATLDVALQAINVGAISRFFTKPCDTADLAITLCQALQQKDRETQRLKLQRWALFDELTGLCNRRYFMERLAQEIQHARRYGLPLCVLMIDLDRFKWINDTFGHLVGDSVLTSVGRLLQETMRATDLSGRYGGEEFCVLLTHTSIEEACTIAERLRQRIAALRFSTADSQTFSITCSIGLTQFKEGMEDTTALLRPADQALYQAKALGRNRIVIATDCTVLPSEST